jgi:hypothetical protein
MNTTDTEHRKILDDIEANPSRYEIMQLLGDKILRIDSSDGSMWLCRNDGGTRRLITLVEHGEVKFLTEADIEPSAMRLIKHQCPYLAFKAHYRFWVFPFTGSKAAVEWTVRPDGSYYADSDGFGMTDDEEITLHGFIDTNGRPIGKFRLYRRK